MIIILGSSGYIGSEFTKMFDRQGIEYRGISRREVDYSHRDSLIRLIRETKPEFLINAAGYTGKPNVDACELHKADCLMGNAVLPGVVREACESESLTWGHVSSGCIYTGAREDGSGFRETDPPNFSFRTNNCSFYSGTKALGEEVLAGAENCYVWRLRIPFNHEETPRNYLTKLMRYNTLLEATNSVSQLNEFVQACLETWTQRVDTGIYNITNPGKITTRQVVAMIQAHLLPEKEFKFFDDESQFMQFAAKTPRSNCVMDSSKLLATGIHLTPIEEAIEHALKSWTPAPTTS
ncbi:dTDP-4-dehydrorhamnose reductase [Novipirellula galeiformis]|uniref:dTDP-4-dehydrorhamnose reductase n=1 Tax=Novipirellula galeiformis TaxID=2528004 RepID=A0A5C6CQP1_9BACT|nr:sugar nucleotide-binding protein [Novipirellula galeiformis]TWU27223.1 dTDP-4-dehydrorhamnose reductase [Novipirellula galeiformis]